MLGSGAVHRQLGGLHGDVLLGAEHLLGSHRTGQSRVLDTPPRDAYSCVFRIFRWTLPSVNIDKYPTTNGCRSFYWSRPSSTIFRALCGDWWVTNPVRMPPSVKEGLRTKCSREPSAGRSTRFPSELMGWLQTVINDAWRWCLLERSPSLSHT